MTEDRKHDQCHRADDSQTALAAVHSACEANDLAAILGLLPSIARLNKAGIIYCKALIRARFGDRFRPRLLNAAIERERSVFLRSEAELCITKSFVNDSRNPHSTSRPKDPAAVSMGRRGGSVRGVKKGLAALSAERSAEIRLMAFEARRQKRAQRG